MTRWIFAAMVFGTLLGRSPNATAQYKNAQFGFEAGYLFYGSNQRDNAVQVDNHGPLIGLRGAFKASDHWWFTSRGAFSFREELGPGETVYMLHIIPLDARYYLKTDKVRPFVGVTQSFQIFLNGNAGNFFWGPGASVGSEFKLRRDVFFGLEGDFFYMFGDGEFPVVAITAQINLFF